MAVSCCVVFLFKHNIILMFVNYQYFKVQSNPNSTLLCYVGSCLLNVRNNVNIYF